jgi:hypothetical protein
MVYAHVELAAQYLPNKDILGLPTPQDIWGDPIRRYIASSKGMNQELRAGIYSTLSRWIVTGIMCRPKYEGPTFRGLRKDPNWEVGHVHTELGFTATAQTRQHAEVSQYCGGVLLIIRRNNKGYDLTEPPIHTPQCGAPVLRRQAVSGEREVVFLPKTRFKVEMIHFMPGVRDTSRTLKVYSVSVL